MVAIEGVQTGQDVHQTRAQHRAIEFRKFLDLIDAKVTTDLNAGNAAWSDQPKPLV